ncbi:MAG: hypothetical protein ACLQDA_07815 [Terracidiphilus sp.]
MTAEATAFGLACCAMCGEHSYCGPLHGDRGGPLCCLLCIGKWEAEHRPRQRARRVVIKALKAYTVAGGSLYDKDFDRLKITASGLFRDDDASVDFSDLTTELLTATLALTHPDKHPSERKAEAQRVTHELLALKPFVFPAPEPDPPPKRNSKRDDGDLGERLSKLSPLLDYPCDACRDTVPSLYCNACRAEYDNRAQQNFERRTTTQRAEYARRRKQVLAKRPPAICQICLKEFTRKRSDARFCSDRCRQQAHRKEAPVTHRHKLARDMSFNRDRWRRAILALLDRHSAVYLNDLLSESRTRAEYQQLCRVVTGLEDAGQIETMTYLLRFNHPGHKVLVKPGYTIKDRNVRELKNNERLPTMPK